MGNKANRQCAKVDIRELKTMAPFLYFVTANTVGLDLSGDTVYAKAMGANKIGFDNPWDGSFSIEAQVFPMEYLAMLSDGVIEDNAVDAVREEIKATEAGTLTLPTGTKAGTVYVYKEGEWGGTPIEGTFSETTFTAKTADNIAVGSTYEVGYLITKSTGVRKVSLNNKKATQDYYVTLFTNDKDEDGLITAKKYTIYKCKPKRTFSVSHSSEGDPMSVKIDFQALEDKNGNFVDITEVE
ncbi:hypothetical protein [Hungatella hathewayi]|uniref:hypothetical protein n=1 Tax=Hungatella hathewayi TaxID=154046 RepID=UPI0035685024